MTGKRSAIGNTRLEQSPFRKRIAHANRRLPGDWLSRLLADRDAIVLTDDDAPIDRLLGRLG